MRIEIRVLGPLEAAVDGLPVRIPGGRERALLARLAVGAGAVVPSGDLVSTLWGERPPANPHAALQTHLSRLRRMFRDAGVPAPLLSRAGGYALDVATTDVRLRRVKHLCGE